MTKARWKATVWYRTDNGLVDVIHMLEELEDIHDLVEAGPHWDTVHEIKIERVSHNTGKNLTVEEAALL